MKELTDDNFATELGAATTPVVVDFWAPWCGPCVGLTPTLEALAKEYAGKVEIVKVNVDQCPETASRFGVRSIPTLKFFKQGTEVMSLTGARPKGAIQKEIEGVLK